MAKGENVAMGFIQLASGDVIDGHRARDIRSHLRTILNYLATQTKPHRTWGKLDSFQLSYIISEMGKAFPELLLCENNWKIHRIGTDNYSNWYKVRFPPDNIKTEPVDEDGFKSEDPTAVPVIKRSHSPSTPLPKKKKKLDLVVPSSLTITQPSSTVSVTPISSAATLPSSPPAIKTPSNKTTHQLDGSSVDGNGSRGMKTSEGTVEEQSSSAVVARGVQVQEEVIVQVSQQLRHMTEFF